MADIISGRNQQLLSRNLLGKGNQDDFISNNYQTSEMENYIDTEQCDIELEEDQ